MFIMVHKICSLFIFVLTSFVLPVLAGDDIDRLVGAVKNLSIENSKSVKKMTWNEQEEARKLLNRIDFIRLDLQAIESSALAHTHRLADSYGLESRNRKKINKFIRSTIKNSRKLHDLFENDLSFFPQKIKISILEQENHLQAIYYDVSTIQSLQEALDRIEKFQKVFQNFVEIILFQFLKKTYPQIF